MSALRAGSSWHWPLLDGTLSSGTLGGGSAPGVVEVALTGGCVDPDGGDPWIECVIDPRTPAPEGLRFTDGTAVTSADFAAALAAGLARTDHASREWLLSAVTLRPPAACPRGTVSSTCSPNNRP